jgi:hypothetical protein
LYRQGVRWLGLSLDLLGVLLVAAEDVVVPLLQRTGELAASARRDLIAAFHRWRGKSVDAVVQVAGGGGARAGGFSPMEKIEMDPEADVETQLAFLRSEARRTREQLTAHERQIAANRQRIEQEEKARARALEELREELSKQIRAVVESSRLRYIRLRRVGLVLVVVGSICLVAA